jgi:hypothetical protein
MRAEIRYRAATGTSSWHGRGRPSYAHAHGGRESEGGRGAFGGFRGGDGRWEPYDTGEFNGPKGSGEERYMTNLQFLGLIGGIVSLTILSEVGGADEVELGTWLGADPAFSGNQGPRK